MQFAQCCDYTKNDGIIHIKMMNIMLCVLDLMKNNFYSHLEHINIVNTCLNYFKNHQKTLYYSHMLLILPGYFVIKAQNTCHQVHSYPYHCHYHQYHNRSVCLDHGNLVIQIKDTCVKLKENIAKNTSLL